MSSNHLMLTRETKMSSHQIPFTGPGNAGKSHIIPDLDEARVAFMGVGERVDMFTEILENLLNSELPSFVRRDVEHGIRLRKLMRILSEQDEMYFRVDDERVTLAERRPVLMVLMMIVYTVRNREDGFDEDVLTILRKVPGFHFPLESLENVAEIPEDIMRLFPEETQLFPTQVDDELLRKYREMLDVHPFVMEHIVEFLTGYMEYYEEFFTNVHGYRIISDSGLNWLFPMGEGASGVDEIVD